MNALVAAHERARLAGAAAAPASHLISREIGIDAGHRVTDHGSKCRNIHGHRYTIQAWCRGPLFDHGEQAGMVLDFGFLKQEMLAAILDPCDHGFLFWAGDALCWDMFGRDEPGFAAAVDEAMARDGCYAGEGRGGMRIYILPFVPTAENLARHWFGQLAPRVAARSDGLARLVCVKVWETPNCWAAFGPEAGP
jgi:6-pyruvoyltetrahydropterin/6-carboxytetrahydropterin synthase